MPLERCELPVAERERHAEVVANGHSAPLSHETLWEGLVEQCLRRQPNILHAQEVKLMREIAP